MHILGKLYQDLAVLFASNIPLIIILVAKVFFNKKFSTKYFLIFLILTIIITIAEFVEFKEKYRYRDKDKYTFEDFLQEIDF